MHVYAMHHREPLGLFTNMHIWQWHKDTALASESPCLRVVLAICDLYSVCANNVVVVEVGM